MDVHIERWAGDAPTVVLLHAGVADSRSWHGVARELSGLDIVAYDRRGFGRTPPAAGDFSDLADLITVLDDVAPRRPAWLVGSSMGGGLAVDAAITAPHRVAGLVLIAPTISGAPEPPDSAYDEQTQQIGAAIDAAARSNDVEELNRLEVRLWLDGPAGPEGRVGGDARALALDMNRVALTNGTDDDAGASDVHAWNRLAEIRAPVTVTWGDLDIPLIVERTQELALRLPTAARTYEFPGNAHLPYLERPAEVADVVRAAIGR